MDDAREIDHSRLPRDGLVSEGCVKCVLFWSEVYKEEGEDVFGYVGEVRFDVFFFGRRR